MSWRQYFARKSIKHLVAEAESGTELERSLGAVQLTMLGIGAIIGAGIFVLTGSAASLYAGPAIIISFVLSGIICVCAGLCYAELASMIPVSGSSYTYAYATLGEVVAWIMAGCLMLTYFLSSALVASGWSSYTISFLQDYGITFSPFFTDTTGTLIALSDGAQAAAIFNIPSFAIVMLLTFILYLGSNTTATVNAIAVAIKMAVLFGFIAVGMTKVDPGNWMPFIPENQGDFGSFGMSGIIGGTAIILLAFNGFDTVATAAQEAKNPQKDLPIGILSSILVCTVTYILVAIVLTGLVPYTQLNIAQPIGLAVDNMGMPWFSTLIKIGAIAALTSVLLVLLFALSRILLTITHDGLLPAGLGKIHRKYRTPYIITVGVGLLIGTLSAMVPLEKLAQLSSFGMSTSFIIVCVGVLFLRYTQPELPRKFKCPLMPWVPLIGIASFIQMLVVLPMEIYVYALLWLALILVFYFVYSRHHSKLFQQRT